jgi:hypothetical protein
VAVVACRLTYWGVGGSLGFAMTKIKPEHKDRMMRIGVWPQFWAELVASIADGEPDKVAKRRLIAKYLGIRCGRPKAVLVDLPADGGTDIEFGSETPARREAKLEREKEEAQLKMKCLSAFEGREASEVEIIRWVVRNMDVKDVGVKDCPDPAAWTFLKECRASANFRQTFLAQVWAKILPARVSTNGDEGKNVVDGSDTISMIEKIQALRGGAVGSSQGSCL